MYRVRMAMLVAALAVSGGWMWQASPGQRGGGQRPQGQRPGMREDLAPKVGTDAPDFTLKTLDGKQEVKLSALEGKKPVCLIFGSYT